MTKGTVANLGDHRLARAHRPDQAPCPIVVYLDPATNPDAVLTAHAQCAACEFDVRGDLVTPKPALTAGLDALLAQRPCLARDHERPTASR